MQRWTMSVRRQFPSSSLDLSGTGHQLPPDDEQHQDSRSSACDEQWRCAIVPRLDLCGHRLPPDDERHQDGLAVLRWTMVLRQGSWLDLSEGTNFHQMTNDLKMDVPVLQRTMALRHRSRLDLCGHQLPPDDERPQDDR